MFDFVGNSLAHSFGKKVAEAADEKPINLFPNGPVQLRRGGSQSPQRRWRRLEARRQAAYKRKINRNFRRDWMRNERAFNTLQQQLIVVGALPSSHYAEPALVDNVERHLEVAYGSVEKALSYFEGLAAERAAA